MKNRLLLFIICLLPSAVFAQGFEWQAGMTGFFDNTEFEGSEYQHPQTMAGVRFAPEISYGIDSVHKIHVGFNALTEYGSSKFIDDVVPTAYYFFDGKPFKFYMGSFPRKGLLDELPKAYYQDSIEYYRPNMTGILWQYSNSTLDVKGFLDWTTRKTKNDHESFFTGGMLKYRKSLFIVDFNAIIHHYAGSETVKGVHENAIVNGSIGLDLKQFTPLDVLDIRTGYLGGYERDRNLTMDWTVRHGMFTEFNAAYKKFAVKGTNYVGAGLMSDYETRGNAVYWGDPFYRASFYTRADLMYNFLQKKNISLNFKSSQHFLEGHCFFEQSLILNVNVGN